MRSRIAAAAVFALTALVAIPGILRAQEEPAPAAEADAQRTVTMLKFKFHDRQVEGRLAGETETSYRIADLADRVIGYQKSGVTDLTRAEIGYGTYQALQADYLFETAPETDDPAATLFAARRTYMRALLSITDEGHTERIRRKIELIDTERKDAQAEALRQERMRREKAETELVEAEKKLVEQQVADLKKQQLAIKQLQEAFTTMQKVVVTMQERQDALLAFAKDAEEAFENIDDELEDLDDRCDGFTTRRYVDDSCGGFKKSAKSLSEDVAKLRQEVNRLKQLVERMQDN